MSIGFYRMVAAGIVSWKARWEMSRTRTKICAGQGETVLIILASEPSPSSSWPSAWLPAWRASWCFPGGRCALFRSLSRKPSSRYRPCCPSWCLDLLRSPYDEILEPGLEFLAVVAKMHDVTSSPLHGGVFRSLRS